MVSMIRHTKLIPAPQHTDQLPPISKDKHEFFCKASTVSCVFVCLFVLRCVMLCDVWSPSHDLYSKLFYPSSLARTSVRLAKKLKNRIGKKVRYRVKMAGKQSGRTSLSVRSRS